MRKPGSLRRLSRAFFWLAFSGWATIGPSRGQVDVLKPPEESPLPAGPLTALGDSVAPASAIVAPGGIVAVVGDEVITQAELERRLQQERARYSAIFPATLIEQEMPKLAWSTLQDMIGQRLVIQLVRIEEQKNEGHQIVTPAQIDYQVERQVERIRKTRPEIKSAEDLYRMAEQVDGLSQQEYRRFLKEQIEFGAYLREFVLKGAETYVSPEETRVYYRTHLDEFTTPVEIAFRQILISLNREDALARKEAVEAGLKAGESFVELAKMHSQEALDGRPEAAGHLFRKSFEDLSAWHYPIPDVLRTLKVGQVSEPVRTVAGIHFFYVEDLVPGEPKPFAEAQETIRNRLRVERENAAIREFIAELRRKSFCRVFLPRPPGLDDRDLAAEERSDAEPVGQGPVGQGPVGQKPGGREERPASGAAASGG